MVVEFGRRALPPVDDVLSRLRDTIAMLTRSSLHQCLERDASPAWLTIQTGLPDRASSPTSRSAPSTSTSASSAFESTPTMVLAIDRVSKVTWVEVRDNAGTMNGADVLRGVVAAFPYAIPGPMVRRTG